MAKTRNVDATSEDDDDFQEPLRQLVGENESACAFFLQTVRSNFQLKIGSSLMKDGGNGIFVTQDVPAAHDLYRTRPSIICVNQNSPAICHNCLYDSSSLLLMCGRFRSPADKATEVMPCSGCKVARFCSKECQKAAWAKFHKHECKILAQTPGLPARSLAVFRVLLQRKAGRLSTAYWKAIGVLQTNFHKYMEKDSFDFISSLAAEAGEKTKSDVPIDTLWSLACTMMTNCLTIRPAAQKKSLGASLDLVTSLMNHSCNANVFIFFEGDELRARSIRAIRAGEELTRCYCDPTMDVLLRQHVLRNEQFFTCQCEKCKKELKELRKLIGKEKPDAKAAALLKSQRDILDLVQSAGLAVSYPGLHRDFEDLEKVEAKLRFIRSAAFPATEWPDHLEPLPSARLALGALRLHAGQVLEALRLMLRGCMLGSRDRVTCAAEWVNEMVDLVRVLMVLGNAPPTSDVFTEDEALPRRDEIRQLVNGYLHEVNKTATVAFGSDAAYRMAIGDWFNTVLRGTSNAPRPGTSEFEPTFRLLQAKLLVWAGVDKYEGMALST